MKILVVEDESKTTAFLHKGLTESGFDVDVSKQGEEGFQRAQAGDYDLLILDVMLPERNGWSILSELRRERKNVPVLFLTARDTVQDRVKGLELGADDYLVKPFAFSELLARVRSILRRTSGTQPQTVGIADLELDLIRHKATRGGTRLELTPKEFALLALLARRQGEVLTRPFLAEQVWEMHFGGETNVVDVHVRRLRSKMDDPFPKKLIHTVRGVGYVLEERP
jgi:two-component system copper resistance phosphate regulon response regulator CusR